MNIKFENESLATRYTQAALKFGWQVKTEGNVCKLESSTRDNRPPFQQFIATQTRELNYNDIIEAYSKYPFIQDYISKESGGGIGYDECFRLTAKIGEEISAKNVEFFIRGIFFCPFGRLKDLLSNVEVLFFGLFPKGQIRINIINNDFQLNYHLIKFGHIIQSYPEFCNSLEKQRGCPVLEKWTNFELGEFIRTNLTLANYFFPPFVTGFMSGHQLGMIIEFIFDKPVKYQLIWGEHWLDFISSKASFTYDSNMDKFIIENRAYQKYCFRIPPENVDIKEFYEWYGKKLNGLTEEIFKPENYLAIDDPNEIDVRYAFESFMTMIHLSKLNLSTFGLRNNYLAKDIVFQVADLYSSLWAAREPLERNPVDFFKKILHPDCGEKLRQILMKSKSKLVRTYGDIAKKLYAEFLNEVKKSVWFEEKVDETGVLIKGVTSNGDVHKNWGEFVPDVIRGLRNTHHGYFSRLDEQRRPERLLLLVDGALPDTVPSLTLCWWLAFLESSIDFFDL